jgi:azobenzene reductase
MGEIYHAYFLYLSVMKIAVVLGTTRIGRQSEKVATELVKRLIAHEELSITFLDIARYPFPVFEERITLHPNPPAELIHFSEQLRAADGIIFVIPEYNGSLPGTFKNAFDHFYAEYKRKPIGVVCVSDGKFAGVQASLQLQTLILHVFAYPMPTKLLVPFVLKAFDEGGTLIDENVDKGMNKFIDEYLWFAKAIVTQKMNSPI